MKIVEFELSRTYGTSHIQITFTKSCRSFGGKFLSFF
jgi:hypothetical protein